MISQSTRLQSLDEGVFQELALVKRKLISQGQHVIDLSVGSPDLPPPPHAIDVLQSSVGDAREYGYAIAALPAFHDAVVSFYGRYDVTLDGTTDVLQLIGSQDGLAHLALATLNPGDVVLLPDPGYPIYEASVRLAGGEIYPLPLDDDTLHPRFEAVPADILQRAKMMILNYPSNPTAGIATRVMFERVIDVAKQYDIFVVHDFAYSEMVYDGHEAISILSVPGAKDVAVEFNSLSKTFNLAGCRIGYVVGNPNVIGYLRKLKSHIDFGVFLPIQRAAIAALTTPWDGYQLNRQLYTERRDVFCSALTNAGWNVRKPAATMFVWTETPNQMPSYEFSMKLLREKGVSVTPGAAFGPRGEGHVRMAIVHDKPVLVEAAERIRMFLAQV